MVPVQAREIVPAPHISVLNLDRSVTAFALFRMSKRLASEWLGLRAHRQLHGHDEALVAAVCEASAQCQRTQMHFPGGGCM